MDNKSKVIVYYGNDCITKYWIWNEEHNCIAYGKIASKILKKSPKKDKGEDS